MFSSRNPTICFDSVWQRYIEHRAEIVEAWASMLTPPAIGQTPVSQATYYFSFRSLYTAYLDK